ncbi:hypothetical protein [Arthrospiribacter ruber]|uniref:Uncharacterized protein n=1 Tax=Arthrospiribacter ruber TaxID=2487934 RepID=A0A951IVZ7_9BACT|nr:hypothetical protein [Arthrospiribacter ruber]MBW3467234.1 hypothetical protein [Arthrospiribacter ruber]
MANNEKNFDQFFKEKLEKHQEKPSALAWERLESQLPKKEKSGFYPFMSIAAAIVLLLAAGIVLLNWSGESPETKDQVAELQPNESKDSGHSADTSLMETEENTGVIPEPKENNGTEHKQERKTTHPQKGNVSTPSFQEPSFDKMVAETRNGEDKVLPISIEVPEIKLPEPKITETIALNTAVEEEPVYKVTIKSRGLKEEAPKQGLIGELEEKVEKIEGIWNKLGQGFADLQDAKENLFANNNPRRERSK